MTLTMCYLDVTLCSQVDHNFFGLESIKELYATDFDLKDAYENRREGRTWDKYVLYDGLLYCANKLCVSASFVHLLFLQEVHGGGLMVYFGVNKTEYVLADHFFCPKMRRDVERYVPRCTTCNKAKSRFNPHDLCMPLSISSVPWEIMHHILLICSSLRLFIYMVFQILLS
jgi:hypothetical protein